MVNWDRQLTWDEVIVGDEIPSLRFPLSPYRLVVEAGANRDFNSIHHNTQVARAAGAPDMYANTFFLQGMWERTIREFIGVYAKFVRMTGFRMHRFNPVGQVVTVRGRVHRSWREGNLGLVDLEMWSETAEGATVGPGHVFAAVPVSESPPTDEDIRVWLGENRLTFATVTPEPDDPGDWRTAWREVARNVGVELGTNDVIFGADAVDHSGLRRYLEPLEFDCPLHTTLSVAKSAGYADLVLPWSANIPFTTEAFWSPGDPPVFIGTEYDAQPTHSPYAIHEPIPSAPVTSAFMATETSVMEFTQSAVLGDRVGRIGRKVVDCQPKETRVGRGAFVRFQAEIRNQDDVTVSRSVRQYFYYDSYFEPNT